MNTVDFYFDYLSPFSYLASLRVREVCAAAGAEVVFRPVLFPALLNHWGQRGPAEIPPKSVHTFKECLRYALARGQRFRAPKLHPFNPLLALRATWAADSEDERQRAAAALYALGWADGGDLSSSDEIQAALTSAGLPAPSSSSARSPTRSSSGCAPKPMPPSRVACLGFRRCSSARNCSGASVSSTT